MKKILINMIVGVSAMLASTMVFATTFGPVENFDVVNDTGKIAHGFEIEMHDLRQNEITSIFGDATRWPDMERYGSPTVTEYSDPSALRTHTSTRITYRANFNGGWNIGTPSGTLPVSPSDSCWPYGAPNYGPDYPCDHFGVSTSIPAASVKYSWLVESSPGSSNLVYQDSSVPAPVWTVVPQPPVNNQPQPPKVNVAIAAPKPNNYEFGEPKWVKVTATGTLNNVAVEDLIAENQVIQKAKTQTQIEWQLLQTDSGNPAAGQIDLTGVALDKEATGIVYRFEFYNYTGSRDPETNEAKSINGDTATPAPADLGKFIVAQMAAVNFDGQVPPLPPQPAAPIVDTALTDVVVNVPYSAAINATPSNEGDVLNYDVTGLPDGLSVDTTTGVISGTVNALGGPYPLSITVTDTNSGLSTSATTSISIVDGTILFSPVDQNGVIDTLFSYTLTATGGTGVFTYTTLDTLPDGLLLDNSTGIISGKPTTPGSFALNFIATDSAGYALSAPLNITIASAAIVANPNACSGTNLVITNGLNVRAHLLDVNGGVLNGGQTVQYAQNTTTIVPPLTSADFYNAGNLATFTGTNTNGICIADQITVSQGLTVGTIANQTLSYGAVMTPVSVNVTGGVAPYTVVVNGLPSGLSFDGSSIVGASTSPGTFPVTISVNDSNTQTRIQTISLTVNPPPAIVLGSTNIPASGTIGVLYTGSAAATGGYGALTWTATGLPAGVNISPAGVISGNPTTAATYNAILTVTDSIGTKASVNGSIVISPAPVVAGISCTKPAGATGGLNSKGKITAINGNMISFKTSSGARVSVTVPVCATIQWNGGAKAFALGQVFEWNGYSSAATGNVAQKVTIN